MKSFLFISLLSFSVIVNAKTFDKVVGVDNEGYSLLELTLAILLVGCEGSNDF